MDENTDGSGGSAKKSDYIAYEYCTPNHACRQGCDPNKGQP
jgi:hypothetical protein